ncbi:MAG: PAS domain-containing protein [Helicobacteraceae bacterium]|nr:PAS domain-containing protein [Helicobacteraceae bacterium]
MNSEIELDGSRYRNWMEYDYNPFFVFNQNGIVTYLNRSAELLSGYEPIRTFNDLALSYASIDFGYKTTFMPLNFGKFHFFAITVGYEDENSIGIKLYQAPAIRESAIEKMKNCNQTNIYVLIDIAISLAKGRLQAALFRNEFDPAIPEFKLSQNDFTKILRKIYDGFDPKCKLIATSLKLKAGEFLRAGGEKYQLVELRVSGAPRIADYDDTIDALSNGINIAASFESDSATLEVPLVIN